jgi:8-oxo-dGTP pyrophosphatase MutT (NUDIX family)
MICSTNLAINRVGWIKMDIEFVKIFYRWDTIQYQDEMRNYLCRIPLPVWIVMGEDAIVKMLKIKKNFRIRYSRDLLHTLFHTSDSQKDAEREINLINKSPNLRRNKMKTNNQVEVIVYRVDARENLQVLILKRNPQKGGFWQPITGNVNADESFEEAALRELLEETGISQPKKLVNTDYSFSFFDDGRDQYEEIFGAEVGMDTPIRLSEEHSELAWVSPEDAIANYLKYPGNKEGIRRLIKKLQEG